MRVTLGFLVAVLLVFAAEASKKCTVSKGMVLTTYSGSILKMKVPCKYNMIHQRCGRYNVVLTPGNRFLHPTYFVDTVWIHVNDTDDNLLWQGRTTDKMARMYLVKGDREPFHKLGGSMELDTLFDVTKSSKDVSLITKNGDFRITYGPFDVASSQAKDSYLEFECNADVEEVDFPGQFCGSSSPRVLKDRIADVFKNSERSDLIVLHDIFDDNSITQMDAHCMRTTEILAGVSAETRKEAIRACHLILDSPRHQECAIKYACHPMQVFTDCVQFVASGYDKRDPSCYAVGQAIDMCRNFPTLTDKIQEADCYKDFITNEDLR